MAGHRALFQRDAFYLAAAQCVLYTLIMLNTRAIVRDAVPWAVFSDALIASLNFCVLRRIGRLENGAMGYVGYLAGSIAGTVLGLLAARCLGV